MEEILPAPHDEHQSAIVRASVVLVQRSAADLLSNQVHYLDPSNVLAHAKLRHELPTSLVLGFRCSATWKHPSPSTKPATEASSLSC
jgi:hypothetical protein